MLHDLDKTIELFLRHELPADLAASVAVSFAAPDENFPPSSVTGAAVNLFLIECRENRELRDTEPYLTRRDDGSVVRQRPPVRIDCVYMVTAWAKAGATNPEEDEHRILGEVLRVLMRHPKLPGSVLQGALEGQMPPVRSRALPAQLQPSAVELWHSLKGRVRASFLYIVTICMDVHEPEEAEAPVRGLSSSRGE